MFKGDLHLLSISLKKSRDVETTAVIGLYWRKISVDEV